MSNSNFSSQVRHVQAGSPVSAGNTSRATRDLEGRTNFLREAFSSAEAGQVLTRHDQPLHSEVQVGDAVYWDADQKAFGLAMAAVLADPETGALVTAPSADCLGLCIQKRSPTSGTIATVGMLKVSQTVLENMTGGDTLPGRYYLSPATPGKLVRQRPAVTVAVAHVIGPVDDCETDVWIWLMPQMRDFLEDHIHYQIELVAQPAGQHSPPLEDSPHVITSPDSNLPGWLPADHAVFGGKAPAGAVFGYNLSQHADLQRIWPPIPLKAAILEQVQPNAVTGPQIVGMSRVPEDYVIFDNFGIWWMTDCYNQVPWDASLDTAGSEGSYGSSESEAACPVLPEFSLLLSFLKMTFATDRNVVTSLRPADGSPLKFVGHSGEPAVTGDLAASLDLEVLTAEGDATGGQVLKEILDEQLRFSRGWVAEGLVAGSPEVLLSSSHTSRVNPDSPAGPGNPALHQGIVTVTLQTEPGEREISPQIVKLEDTLESEYQNITYLGFPSGRTSSIRARLNIPANGLPLNPVLRVRALLFGRANGPFPAMTLSYYRVARPVAGTPTPITSGDTPVVFDVVTPSNDYDGAGTDLPLDNAIEVESEDFSIASGDTIYLSITRDIAATPLFLAELGLIRFTGVISSGG